MILNLGCGTKASKNKNVINIDWSVYLRIRRNNILRPFIPLLICGERLKKLTSIPDNILVHNLKKGIPFSSDSIDAVYHSHMLEHFDKGIAETFLLEVKRVLKPGGIHRIVVPDFERACRAYIEHVDSCKKNQCEINNHDAYIASLIEMSVRKEAYGTSQQRPLRRFIENIVLGDARKRGETHQWMYDRVSLEAKLSKFGYKKITLQDYNTSMIENWADYGLDVDEYGNQYKPGSLYMEAIK